MKKIILVLLIILVAGCNSKKDDKLNFRCIKSIVSENYTYKEVVGYYSYEDGNPSKLIYMEDYIPSTKENSLGIINEVISKKQKDLKQYENANFNRTTKNNKIYIDYYIYFNDKNIKLIKDNDKYKKYMKDDLFEPDKFLEDMVINGYICE